MLTESQFVQCEKIAHQTMPALKAQLDRLDADYLHKGFDLPLLAQMMEPLILQHTMDFSQTILALCPLPASENQTLVVTKAGLYKLNRRPSHILNELLQEHIQLPFDRTYEGTLCQILGDKHYKLPAACPYFSLFPVGSKNDEDQTLWLNPASLYHILPADFGQTIIHTTYGLSLLVSQRPDSLTNLLRQACLCHGILKRQERRVPGPTTALQSFLGFSSTPILDRVLDKLCVQDIPGKRGSFLPTYLALHDAQHREDWELAAEATRRKCLAQG